LLFVETRAISATFADIEIFGALLNKDIRSNFPPGFVEGWRLMACKPLELPPGVARGFVQAMDDYFAEESPTKRDAIAAHQLSVPGQYQNPREKKLRLSDVREMFFQVKDQRNPNGR